MTAAADDRFAFACPRQDCRHRFVDRELRAGTIVDCPACARPMNARPLAMERELRERERLARGGRGDPTIARLPLAVLADNVRSLWNVGSMFRTADACGVGLVVLTGVSGCPPRDAITKTALGAERAVPWRYRASELEALDELVAEGFRPVALENGPEGMPVTTFAWPARPCLVVGHEIRGISPELLDACPLRVSIPMRGAKDSLNVAVAFAIAVHHAAEALAGQAKVE